MHRSIENIESKRTKYRKKEIIVGYTCVRPLRVDRVAFPFVLARDDALKNNLEQNNTLKLASLHLHLNTERCCPGVGLTLHQNSKADLLPKYSALP